MTDSLEKPTVRSEAVMAEYYGRLAPLNLAPLWERLHYLVPKRPNGAAAPARWDYDRDIRPVLMEAGLLVTAEEAERRVLLLENPGLGGHSSATTSLYAGVQLVSPGEVARAHRHTQTALRFILEGDGAYTAVAGERTRMYPGDLVTTPSWAVHDHGNDSAAPMVWLDVLDIPLVAFLGVGFAEGVATQTQATSRPIGDSDTRYAGNLVPVDWRSTGERSPILNYPYARSRETLQALAGAGDPDPWHGFKMRYLNPASGGHVSPTIGAFIQLLPAGLETRPYRCTDAAIYSVVEGEGESRIADQLIRWKPRDIFVAPSWAVQSHRASSDAVLFSASDRPVHEKLGLWREERGPGAAASSIS
jgi:gentisate 1,2-dioxygenase